MRTFYRDALGMAEVPKPPALAVRGGAWFRAGTCEIHIGVEHDFVPARKAHPALVIADLDLAAGRLLAAGFAVRWDESIPELRRFHSDDPAGNRVEFIAG